jgi:hypothetical protein
MGGTVINIISGVTKHPQRVTIYGTGGVGKTTFSTKFPQPVIIDTEGGADSIDVARTDRIRSWGELVDAVKEILGLDYKTVVLDSLDGAEALCQRAICEDEGKETISDFGYGAGYSKQLVKFQKLLAEFDKCIDFGMNVVLIAHGQITKFEQPDEAASYDRYELKLHKKTAALVEEWSDAVIFANFKAFVEMTDTGKAKARGNERKMYLSHDATYDAKNRWGLEGAYPFKFEVIAPYIVGAENEAMGEREPEPPKPKKGKEKAEKKDPVAEAMRNAVPCVTEEHLIQLKAMLDEAGFTFDDLRAAVNHQHSRGIEGFYPYSEQVADYADSFVVNTCMKQFDGLCGLMARLRPQAPYDDDDIPFS